VRKIEPREKLNALEFRDYARVLGLDPADFLRSVLKPLR
jgi:hypothetical protein